MKKKVKGITGLCLVVALALVGVERYAQAGTMPLGIVGNDGNVYYTTCSSSIGKTSGSAYTAETGSSKCHCSVSATFTWKDSNGNVLYSNGNGAGGMHGASVSMNYTGDASKVGAANVSATHTVNVTGGGYGNCSTSDSW